MSVSGGDRTGSGGVGNSLPSGCSSSQGSSGPTGPGRKRQYISYKLLVDPGLVEGASTKLYRFDGNVPEDPLYSPVNVGDPRSSLALSRPWNRIEGMELPVPTFKIETNYVDAPPASEVTITNINDNVDKQLLKDLSKFGPIKEIFIYYHPVTKKHLGLGRIVFEYRKSAKECVEKMNGKSLMGQVLEAFFDPFDSKCEAVYEELTTEKPKPEPVKVETKIAAVESVIDSKSDSSTSFVSSTPSAFRIFVSSQ